MYGLDMVAVAERVILDVGDGVREVDAFEAGAGLESPVDDGPYGIRNVQVHQSGAIDEGLPSNGFERFSEMDFIESGTSVESPEID